MSGGGVREVLHIDLRNLLRESELLHTTLKNVTTSPDWSEFASADQWEAMNSEIDKVRRELAMAEQVLRRLTQSKRQGEVKVLP